MKHYVIKPTETDENGQNKNLRFNIVDDTLMKNIGFRHTDGLWLLSDGVDDILISIEITDDGVGKIDVLDTYFMQPYDFQKMIIEKGGLAPKTAIEIQLKLYIILDSMKTFGVLEGWEWGDYV